MHKRGEKKRAAIIPLIGEGQPYRELRNVRKCVEEKIEENTAKVTKSNRKAASNQENQDSQTSTPPETSAESQGKGVPDQGKKKKSNT